MMTNKMMAGPSLGEFARRVRLSTGHGHHVADVFIPPFHNFPDVLVWGIRTFIYYGELAADGDPTCAEYREAFACHVPEEAKDGGETQSAR